MQIKGYLIPSVKNKNSFISLFIVIQQDRICSLQNNFNLKTDVKRKPNTVLDGERSKK